MTHPLRSLIDTGSKLWLDSVDPDLIPTNKALGITGATSNPIIVADLIQTGRFDAKIAELLEAGHDDDALAWLMTDHLVRDAQAAFAPVWEKTAGNDGYVSFELDPLLEDVELAPPHAERVERYIALGQQWAKGHTNRMIKVPATAAGLEALEALAAAGVTLNVTLIFTERQYRAAREAIWRGAQRAGKLDTFKSVYSVFISRVDVYTQKQVPELSEAAQGEVGLVIAKRAYQDNERFWSDKGLKLEQEIIFASTGTKLPGDPPDRYVRELAGGGIQTNPPATNEAIGKMDVTYSRTVDRLPAKHVLDEIDAKVDLAALEKTLVAEGAKKFADPHKQLLAVIAERRRTIAAGAE